VSCGKIKLVDGRDESPWSFLRIGKDELVIVLVAEKAWCGEEGVT